MTPANLRETKSQLARRLKIHRAPLDALLAQIGAPAPDKAKTYNVREVVAFVTAAQPESALTNLRTARLHEVVLRCQKLQRELDHDDLLVVSISEVDRFMTRFLRHTVSALYFGVESELPVKLEGLPAAEVRKALREWADSFVDKVNAEIFGAESEALRTLVKAYGVPVTPEQRAAKNYEDKGK